MSNIGIRQLIVGPIGTNCYIVKAKEKKHVVVIDPGAAAERITQAVRKMGAIVEAILLTHGHFDHIGAVDALVKEWGCKTYLLEDEKEVMESSDLNLSGPMMNHPFAAKADVLVKDGDCVSLAGLHFKVIATPGHTKGSCCYYVEEENVLFSGDTMFYSSHGRTDFPTGSESAILRSIRDRLLVLPGETTVYPGHDSVTSIEDEEKWY